MNGEVFNIGGGYENSLSLLELFDLLADLLDIPALIYENKERRSRTKIVSLRLLAKQETWLEWSPSIDCKIGINRMLAWCRENQLVKV